MTLCIVVRTAEGIAIATDTTTTTSVTRLKGETIVEHEFHTYYRKKLVNIGKWGVIYTGSAFINNRAVHSILKRKTESSEKFEDFKHNLVTTLSNEIRADPGFQEIDDRKLILTIGIAGYIESNLLTHKANLIKKDEKLKIQEETYANASNAFGISYFGDSEFVQLILKKAVHKGLMKSSGVLTLREGLDLARTLIRFLIDFQKFMIRSTVDYPIESAVITIDDGFQWIDEMSLDPLEMK